MVRGKSNQCRKKAGDFRNVQIKCFSLIHLTNDRECLSYTCGVKRKRNGKESHSDVSSAIRYLHGDTGKCCKVPAWGQQSPFCEKSYYHSKGFILNSLDASTPK